MDSNNQISITPAPNVVVGHIDTKQFREMLEQFKAMQPKYFSEFKYHMENRAIPLKYKRSLLQFALNMEEAHVGVYMCITWHHEGYFDIDIKEPKRRRVKLHAYSYQVTIPTQHGIPTLLDLGIQPIPVAYGVQHAGQKLHVPALLQKQAAL